MPIKSICRYFYLIQCLKRKEKIEKRRENLYI
jgi:hypothetical protein